MARKSDFETLQNSTARIEVPGGKGTAFFVAQGRLLTCAHVVSSVAVGDKVGVVWRGSKYDGVLVKKIPNSTEKLGTYPDIAEIDVLVFEHPVVRLISDCRPDDPVYVYGYSDTNPNGQSVTAGIEGPTHFGTSQDEELIAFKNGQFRPGLSGAPIYNFRTQGVCGMVKRSRSFESDLGGHGIRVDVLFYHFPTLRPINEIPDELDRSILAPGVKRILKAMSKNPDSVIEDLVYVATDLNSTDSRHRYAVIVEESRRRGFTAVHVSQIPDHQTDLFGKMHSMIESANLVIFDITDEAPDVLYQIGYQRGIADDLGPDAVLVISQGRADPRVRSSPYPVEEYLNDRELQDLLIERLSLAESSV